MPRSAILCGAAVLLIVAEPVFGQAPDTPPSSPPSAPRPQPQLTPEQAALDARDAEARRLLLAGDLDGAERIFRANIVESERVWGAEHAQTLIAIGNLGVLLNSRGRPREAQPLLERALRGLERARPAEDQDRLGMQVMLGAVYAERGRLADAERLLRAAVAIRMRVLGADEPRTLLAQNNLALALRLAGRFDEAEALFRQVAATRRRLQGPDARETVTAENNLAALLAAAGRRDEALALALDVLARVDRSGGDALQALQAMNVVGSVHLDQLRAEDAAPVFERAVAVSEAAFGPDHPQTLQSLGGLAIAYQDTGREAEAVPLLERVRATSVRQFGPDHRITLAASDRLAFAFTLLDRHDEAVRLLRDSDRRRRRAMAPSDPERNLSALLLGVTYLGQGEFGAAERIVGRLAAESSRALGPDNPRTMEYRDLLALSLIYQPRRAALALEPARSVVAFARARRGSGGTAPLNALRVQRARIGQRDAFHYLAEGAWARAQAVPGERAALQGEVFRALQDGVAGEASEAIARMAARRGAEQAGPRLGALATEREALARRWSAANRLFEDSFLGTGDAETVAERARLTGERAGIEQRMAAIDAELRRDFPDYFSLVRSDPLSLAEAQALIGPDEALLIVAPGRNAAHVMAVTRGGIAWHRADVTFDDVRRVVERLRFNVGAEVNVSAERLAELRAEEAGRGEGSFNRTSAHNVYRELIAPVAGALAGKQRVYVVAGGPLSGLPFPLLVTEAPQGRDDDPAALRATPWFGDAHALVHIPALQSLAALRRAPARTRDRSGFIGFGDPVLAGAAVTRGGPVRSAVADVRELRALARLPGTAVELERMRRALGAPDEAVITGSRATESRLRGTDLTGARIIAFATHGLVAGDAGVAEPGLVLTPPDVPSADDDGFLAASEVAGLRFDADWVILSACNTATSDRGAAEGGLGGLARAFLYAGARNLLASHWPVSDAVAPVMTVRTLELERAGMGRAEALQQAMREIRADPRGDGAVSWAHPYYWAPFVLIGDGG